MTTELASFAFIITLAAVVNGLGIVRWLTASADYLRLKGELNIRMPWAYALFASFQFLLHILMWWSLWNVRGAGEINFLTYLYILTGPILLYLGTSMLVPSVADKSVDLQTHYRAARPIYANFLALLWLWALCLSLVLRGTFAPAAPLFAAFLLISVAQRLTDSARVQSICAIANWLLLIGFIGLYAMQLGGSAAA